MQPSLSRQTTIILLLFSAYLITIIFYIIVLCGLFLPIECVALKIHPDSTFPPSLSSESSVPAVSAPSSNPGQEMNEGNGSYFMNARRSKSFSGGAEEVPIPGIRFPIETSLLSQVLSVFWCGI